MRNGDYLNGLIATLQNAKFAGQVREVATALREVRNHGGRLFVCGNGGSSSIASHFAQDLRKNITPAMKAFCLSDNVPFLTAVSNDDDFGKIFSDYLAVEELTRKDVLVGISCSGNSQNVIQAMYEAVKAESTVVALIGRKECQIMEQFLRYPKLVTLMGLHPDIRGQEDLLHVACHMVVGEMMQ